VDHTGLGVEWFVVLEDMFGLNSEGLGKGLILSEVVVARIFKIKCHFELLGHDLFLEVSNLILTLGYLDGSGVWFGFET
jgi:hypothetical protein